LTSIACCRTLSEIWGVVGVVDNTVVEPPGSFGLILVDGVFVVGVEIGVVTMLADGEEGGTLAAVFSSEDDGGVLSVTSLDLDIVIFLFLDCCRSFDNSRAVWEHFDNTYNSVVVRIYNRGGERGVFCLPLP
jgi:hypothetical protein